MPLGRAWESVGNVTGNSSGAEYLATPPPAVMRNVAQVPNEAGNLKRSPHTVSAPYGFFLLLSGKCERRSIK